jgi:hypothetical protein
MLDKEAHFCLEWFCRSAVPLDSAVVPRPYVYDTKGQHHAVRAQKRSSKNTIKGKMDGYGNVILMARKLGISFSRAKYTTRTIGIKSKPNISSSPSFVVERYSPDPFLTEQTQSGAIHVPVPSMTSKNVSLTVHLIQAETRNPFQEHTAPDGGKV